jgi:hypothetical protein
MNGIIGEFRVGEDITIALDAVSGDTAPVSQITAWMKPALLSADRFEFDETATAISLTVSAQSPASAGWILHLPHSATELLAPGIYGIDARIAIGSAIEMTEQSAFIALSKAAQA